MKSDRQCEYDEASALAGPAPVRDDLTSRNIESARTRPSTDVRYPWSRRDVRLARTQPDEDVYATETAPARWFGLLATDTTDVDLDMDSHCSTGAAYAASTQPDVMQLSNIAPSASSDDQRERVKWQAQECMRLQGLEFDMYNYFVSFVSPWIDMFDPMQHFASVVPRLALYNEGLLKAILAIGARHLAIKAAESSCDAVVFQHAAVQYYAETLQYLQSAMRCTSYKNSQELLATTLIISAYEMLDGSGKGWERHLKGVFWIQHTREINGESGGLEQAVWWAWISQDLVASFRERRRCFSFFKPTRPYSKMNAWDKAARMVYLLAQCINFTSDEEQRDGEREPAQRAARAGQLAEFLEEWDTSKGISFDPLPLAAYPESIFKPVWIHPPAFALAVQMYHVSRILLLSHEPLDTPDKVERHDRKSDIAESIDVVAGLASQLTDGASRAYSSQYLCMAGLFCVSVDRQKAILDILEAKVARYAWPTDVERSTELQAAWARSAASYSRGR